MKALGVKFVLLILFISVQNFVFSQGAMSGNGLYVATVFKQGGKNIIYVHKFMTKELVRKISLASSDNIDEVQMSFSGKYIAIKAGTTYKIVDAMSEKIISTVYAAQQVVFPRNGDYFIALKSSSIERYSCDNGKLLNKYTYPSGSKKIYKLKISPGDQVLVAMAVDRVYVYFIAENNIKKQMSAVDLQFRSSGKYFTILSVLGSKVKVSTYNTKTLYQERTYSSETLLQPQNPAGELFTSRCSMSDDGKFVALYTAKGAKVFIYVFDTWNGKYIWTINNLVNVNNELFPHHWTNSTHLIAYGQHLMAGEYDVVNHTSKALGLRIDNFTQSPDLSEANQQKNRKISPDFHYVVVQSGSKMYIRDARIPDRKITYENVEFQCFSPDSKYIIVKKDGAVNVLVSSFVSKALQSNTSAKLYTFDKNLSVVTKENPIAQDAPPPKGYAYFYVNNSKQIVKVDTAKLHYVFRSMKVDGNNVELQVNLVDANGNQFLGATDPSWKYIWCNLLLQNPNGIVSQVNDFQVTEVHETDPTAYALVLDHSGSMGTKRANSLQYGAWDLVQHKRSQDAYMLIKYDTHVKLMSNLTKDKYPVQRYLQNTGLTGFGGGTALIDATYLAVKKLEKSNYKKKVIILFTDGYENASMFSKYDLLTEATKAGIEINVVGFGQEVNEQYLKSIAYNTGGLYIHIYKTSQLKNVFRDVDFKRKNYYSIKFKTRSRGKHIAFLQLCQDQAKHDSIWIPFDNSKQDAPIDKRDIILPMKPRDIKLTQFNKLKIPVNPVLKPVTSKKINKDFQNINFPNIEFATASDKIVSSEKQGIDEIVKFMRKYPYVFLEIDGHTDNQGTHDFNRDLSIRRAEAAKKLIVKAGIAPGRIVTKGFGDTKPIASNDTEEGRAKNRRIEFHIFVQ